jgi:hypothetical protein
MAFWCCEASNLIRLSEVWQVVTPASAITIVMGCTSVPTYLSIRVMERGEA